MKIKFSLDLTKLDLGGDLEQDLKDRVLCTLTEMLDAAIKKDRRIASMVDEIKDKVISGIKNVQDKPR